MGLDVYLYRYDDHAATKAAEDAASQFSEAAWEQVTGTLTYDQLTDAQKAEARTAVEAYNAAHGLDECGDDEARKAKIEINSAKYPEHYFKIGYFRSSYNSSGINSIARDLIGMDLGDIFNPDDDHTFQPDWTLVRESAVEFHRKLSAAPRLRVATITPNMFGPKPTATAKEAISILQTERERKNPFGDDSGYSSSLGEFFGKSGMTVLAAIPGVGAFDKIPAVHLIYEDAEFDYYIQAAEIVIETIDYVLAQPDREKYWLHWSG